MASLSVNEHIDVCSPYGISAANVSTDSVKCGIWSAFELSARCNYRLCSVIFVNFYNFFNNDVIMSSLVSCQHRKL